MATKKPVKPKLKKMPKQPKQSASMEVWKRYDAKAKAIEAENNKIVADYKKKLSAYEQEQRKKESIKASAAKAKAKLSGF